MNSYKSFIRLIDSCCKWRWGWRWFPYKHAGWFVTNKLNFSSHSLKGYRRLLSELLKNSLFQAHIFLRGTKGKFSQTDVSNFGFRKCALISAHYSLSDVFDNLVISLCKFTTFLIPPEVSTFSPLLSRRTYDCEKNKRSYILLVIHLLNTIKYIFLCMFVKFSSFFLDWWKSSSCIW